MVEGMLGTEWPAYDAAELVRYNKVINEPDFLPLHLVPILTKSAKLLATYRGKLITTALGQKS